MPRSRDRIGVKPQPGISTRAMLLAALWLVASFPFAATGAVLDGHGHLVVGWALMLPMLGTVVVLITAIWVWLALTIVRGLYVN